MLTSNCKDYTLEKSPESLPATEKNEFPFLNYGENILDATDNVWYVPYRFYNIKEIRVFKDANQMSGFEALFDVPSDFTGYKPITHTWGTKVLVSRFERIVLSETYPQAFVKLSVLID